MLLLIIGGIQKTTLIDFPQRVAAIVFTQGCNFRCGYCHNPELLKYNSNYIYKLNDFFDFLKSRQGKLDWVFITGGEPTLQSGLYEFIKKIKFLGFEVKLDTNGTNPNIIRKLMNDNLLDYLAMDIKAPIDKYNQIAGVSVNIDNVIKSIDIIKSSDIDYEFRTTVVKSQLSPEDFNKIGMMLQGAKLYYLQKFIPSKCYNPEFKEKASYDDNELLLICDNLKKYIDNVRCR
jgi:pyruvate formate lyase activating enzyme